MKDVLVRAWLGTNKWWANFCHVNHPSCPYKVRPLSLMFWCFGTRWLLTTTSDHLALQKGEPSRKVSVNPCMSLRAGKPNMVRAVSPVESERHKGKPDFHAWGDNAACHRATYPSQHLCDGTGEETPVFLPHGRVQIRGSHRTAEGRTTSSFNWFHLRVNHNRKSCWALFSLLDSDRVCKPSPPRDNPHVVV